MSQVRPDGTVIKVREEGVEDASSKPDEIGSPIHHEREPRRLTEEGSRCKEDATDDNRTETFIGTSPRMLEVYRMVARVAPTQSTVLIQGETGTGKELVARAIHHHSPRAGRPFVPIECGALAESLLESELFGHVKGAFTGALAEKRGLFEAAHGGTCFLDEAGEISPSMQVKLLRVLQERAVKRVGGTESLKVDVRVIAATNQDLAQQVVVRQFRADLYYRLSVITLLLPPLRERREDIPLLAEHFLRTYATANGKPVSRMAPGAMEVLMGYDWPGNVRELEHAIEHAVTLSANPIVQPEDLPPHVSGRARPAAPVTLRDVVSSHVQRMVQETQGNKKRAAQRLGIHRRTLYRIAKRFGISLGNGT
jgi:two-component system response regulator AtoC